MDVLRSNVDVTQEQPANQGLETNLGETERIPEAPLAHPGNQVCESKKKRTYE